MERGRCWIVGRERERGVCFGSWGDPAMMSFFGVQVSVFMV
jgi:hypothetical protein